MRHIAYIPSLFAVPLIATAIFVAHSPAEAGTIRGSTHDAVHFNESDRSLVELCGDLSDDAEVYVGWWRTNTGDNALQAALIVDRIGGDTATVFYSHGHYGGWGIDYSQCESHTAKLLDDDTLRIDFGNGRSGTFDIGEDSNPATFVSSNGTTYGTFERVD